MGELLLGSFAERGDRPQVGSSGTNVHEAHGAVIREPVQTASVKIERGGHVLFGFDRAGFRRGDGEHDGIFLRRRESGVMPIVGQESRAQGDTIGNAKRRAASTGNLENVRRPAGYLAPIENLVAGGGALWSGFAGALGQLRCLTG